MASLTEMTYDILETFNAYSDDSSLSEEHIAFLIMTKRASYVKRLLSQMKSIIPSELKQKICLELEEDPVCNEDLVKLRSTKKIPPTIDATGRQNISDVYLDSRTAKWLNIVGYERLPYLHAGRMNDKQIYVMRDPDDYLVVVSKHGGHFLLRKMSLSIVAENPEKAAEMSSCESEDLCNFWEDEYPLPLDIADLIIKEIKNELTIKFRIPYDTTNNTNDDSLNKNPLDATRRRTKD